MKAIKKAPATEPGESSVKRQASVQRSADSARLNNRPEAIAQRKQADAISRGAHVVAQRKRLRGMFGAAAQFKASADEELQLKAGTEAKNKTGLPDGLKSGIESLSGTSLDDVKVHYNSPEPAQLNALAYAQGSDIHVAPGQEQHLPHEAWHVVQQAEGRVRPTTQAKGGVPVNDDHGLEREADVMGVKALATAAQRKSGLKEKPLQGKFAPVQRVKDEGKRKELDSRMDELYQQTLDLLNTLGQAGEDLKSEYGKQGKEKFKEKAKSVLSGEKSNPTSEVIREGLSRYWATLSTREKWEFAQEALSEVGQGAKALLTSPSERSGGGGRSASKEKEPKEKEKEKEKEKAREKPRRGRRESEEEESSGPGIGWLSELTKGDLETLYDVYKAKREIEDKIAEIQEKVVEGAGDVGEVLGSKGGALKADIDFSKKAADHRQDFFVARRRFEFLRDAIASNDDAERYESEMDALHYALFNIHGPVIVYRLGELTEEGRLLYPEKCKTALGNLKRKHIVRSGKSGASRLLSSIWELGADDNSVERARAQREMVKELTTATDKSWYWLTKGALNFTPTGVGNIKDALGEASSPTGKLAGAKSAAATARTAESKDRDPTTQIFYDAVAGLDVNDINSLNKAIGIVQEVSAKLG